MNRRNFFKNTSLAAVGAAVVPSLTFSQSEIVESFKRNKKAKNIIFMVSDGMSSGTLNMGDLYLNRKTGVGSHWLQLYKDNKVARALMDMASASSIVTDSAAASSSWGGGKRVKNGSLNIGLNGEEHLPIWQKFKKAGKMAGCVTTVPITHATPAGFCVYTKSRNSQADIAENYLDLRFDIMMGGGNEYFDKNKRKDGKDMYEAFENKGFNVVRTREAMLNVGYDRPILGVFSDEGLPYSIDRESDVNLNENIPTLAEMTQKAIDKMKKHPNGFVLQVEAGKVDWAAHGNDIGGLLYDQVAFDEAIKVAMNFAESNHETLVIITSDHGNANPGVIYGKNANDNFDAIQKFTQTNEWILNGITNDFTAQQVIERFEQANKFAITTGQAQEILSYYQNIKQEDGLYNARHLPLKLTAEIQKEHISVGWISQDHSADYTELAVYGPGSHLLKPFMQNTEMHHLMLQAAEVEDKF